MKPKLRFKNFNNEWEEIELRNIASEIAYGMNSASKEYDGDNKLRDKYLEFLKLGCTKKPIESLKLVGLDMSKPDIIKESFYN